MGSQAFLFTAYAIVLNGPERPKNELIGSLQDYLPGTVPAVGLLSAVLIYVSIIAGAIAMFNSQHFARNSCDDAAVRFLKICSAMPRFSASFHLRASLRFLEAAVLSPAMSERSPHIFARLFSARALNISCYS